VRRVLAALKSALPNDIPDAEKRIVVLLHAARHVQRYPATDTKRGRHAKFDRSLLIKVAARLTDILVRETSSRLSFASFVDHYLRLLNFPADVLDALRAGDINLFEAAQLARLTPARLGVSAGSARHTRRDLLRAHLAAHSSATCLRLRVNELLGAPLGEVSTGNGHHASAALGADELELLDDYDSTHLFWEQIKQLVLALRSIQPGDVADAEIDELLEASEPILNVLAKIQRRKERK
jgi:hypothetical protein